MVKDNKEVGNKKKNKKITSGKHLSEHANKYKEWAATSGQERRDSTENVQHMHRRNEYYIMLIKRFRGMFGDQVQWPTIYANRRSFHISRHQKSQRTYSPKPLTRPKDCSVSGRGGGGWQPRRI